MTLTAEDHCRLGRRQPLTPQGNEDAKKNYQDAIAANSKHVPAYAEFSYVFVRECQNAWGEARGVSRQDSLARAQELADKAVALADDPESDWHNDFRARWYRAMVYWNQGDFSRSFEEYAAARQLITVPQREVRGKADLDADMAEALIYHGEPDRAIDLIQDAMARYPDFHYWYKWILGRAYYAAKRYQEAIDIIGEIADPPNDVRLITAASLAQLGKTDATKLPEATKTMDDFKANDPDWSIARTEAYPYANESDRQHWIEGLKLAGLA